MAQVRTSDGVCRPCQVQGKKETQTVFDQSTGDLICTSCGLVLQERCIDESQEWRNFAADGVEMGSAARIRGGDRDGVADSITGALSSTSFSGGGAAFENFQRLQSMADSHTNVLSSSERSLKNVVMKMKDVTSSLQLSSSIHERCVQFLTHLAERNSLGVRHEGPWFFAVVYLACREEGAARTLRELAHSGATEREVPEDEFERQMKKKVKTLEKKEALGSQLRNARNVYIDPQELMARFVSRLQLSQAVCNPATHIAREARRYGLLSDKPHAGAGDQKQQCAVIASAIFMVAHLLDLPEKPRLSDVAVVARIPETAVIAAYEDLKPHAGLLLPEAFKSQVQTRLSSLPPGKPPQARQPVVPGSKVATQSDGR